MKTPKLKDDDIIGSFAALKRAAKQVKEIARQTGTALIIAKDGHWERVILSKKKQTRKTKQGH